MSRESHPEGKVSRRGLVVAAIVLCVGVGYVVSDGIASRGAGEEKLKQWTEAQALPTVAVFTPKLSANISALELPGRMEAYARAPIYARVSGYLKSWTVDIGASVKAGQLLAEIEAPDLDQQLLQAKAALASAQASEALALVTAQRWQAMAGTNSVSRQAIDEKLGDLTVKQAQTKAAQAALDRLEVLSTYKKVAAPFDGIVTARNTDLGALINADNANGLALFVISDVTKLRLYVNVPQNFVPAIRLNAKAHITVPEHPGASYKAIVEASARAVDAASGTTRMQLVVKNANGDLMPGSFANVRFDLPANATAVDVPASALVIDQGGIRVATLDAEDRVKFKTVEIGRDLGRVVEISSGLAADDRVIESPPDGLVDGDKVRVVVGGRGAGQVTPPPAKTSPGAR